MYKSCFEFKPYELRMFEDVMDQTYMKNQPFKEKRKNILLDVDD